MNYNKKSIKLREKKLESKKIRKKQKIKLISVHTVIVIFLLAASVVGGVGLGTLDGLIASAPDITEVDLKPTGFVTNILDSNGEVIQTLSDYTSNRIEVTIEQVPEHLENAVIAIEDSRFREHKGIDIKGMARALFVNISSFDIKEGASTITQQLIKNNVFNAASGETDVFAKIKRKIQEQYLALQAEKKYSKDQILEYYLNTINLGQGTLGVEAAANVYFDKSVEDLTISESAVLAAITRSPSYYDPIENPEYNKDRQQRVLEKMLEQGMITTEEYNEAIEDKVYERIQKIHSEKEEEGYYSYFVDALIKQVVEDMQEELGYTQNQAYNQLYSGGLTIYSTQDTKLQNIVDGVINDESNYPSTSGYSLTYRLSILDENGETKNYSEYDVMAYVKKKGREDASLIYSSKKQAEKDVAAFRKTIVKDEDNVTGESFNMVIQPQASVTLIDQKSGKVKALAGGRGEKTSNLSLNRATGAARQPGSTFKVLAAFLPALDTKGKTLATVYDDAPYKYAGTSRYVKNYYSRYRGLCTIREAIIDSLNIITAKTMEDVTPKVGFDYLKKLGFTTLVENEVDANGKVLSDVVQPLALGGITNGVTNLELTAAYAAIANEGVYVEPRLYTKILDHDGEVLYKNKKKKNRVMKETTAWLLTSAMQDAVKKGTGTRARLSTGMPAAGKTGTTTNNVDFWFSGYTPYLTASVWMGYDINNSFSGSNYPKVIWKQVMDKAIREKDYEYKNFPSASNIVSRTICTESGLLAVNGVCNTKDYNCTRTEYFEKGTAPTKKCDLHTKVVICKESELPAGKYCPETCKEEKVYLLKEEKYSTGTWDSEHILPKKFKKETCDKHNKKTWKEEQRKKKLEEQQKKQQQQQQVPTDPAAASTAAPPVAQ